MRIGANLNWLFADRPMHDRIDAAGDAGFDAVELLRPDLEDPVDFRHALEVAALEVALINTPEPEWESGQRGAAALPGEETRAREQIDAAIAWARSAGAGLIHVMSGFADGEEATRTLVGNLTYAADTAPELGFTIEPLNSHDAPGYFLTDFAQAAGVIASVDRPNVGLQFDSYQAARMGLDPADVAKQFRSITTHVQLGAAPDRTEPDDAANARLFPLLAEFDGCVSGEYAPRGRTEDGLAWISVLRPS